MATYCYSNAGRKLTVEKQFPIGTAPDKITIASVEFERDIAAEHSGQTFKTGKWPCHSRAMGVLPGQQEEFKALAKKHGVSMEFDKQNRCVMNSPQHKKDLMRVRQMNDFDSYG